MPVDDLVTAAGIVGPRFAGGFESDGCGFGFVQHVCPHADLMLHETFRRRCFCDARVGTQLGRDVGSRFFTPCVKYSSCVAHRTRPTRRVPAPPANRAGTPVPTQDAPAAPRSAGIVLLQPPVGETGDSCQTGHREEMP